MQKIILNGSAEKFLECGNESTGILIGNEHIPFSSIVKVKGNTIWLKPEKVYKRRAKAKKSKNALEKKLDRQGKINCTYPNHAPAPHADK